MTLPSTRCPSPEIEIPLLSKPLIASPRTTEPIPPGVDAPDDASKIRPLALEPAPLPSSSIIGIGSVGLKPVCE